MSFVFVEIRRARPFVLRVHKRAHAPAATLAKFLEVPISTQREFDSLAPARPSAASIATSSRRLRTVGATVTRRDQHGRGDEGEAERPDHEYARVATATSASSGARSPPSLGLVAEPERNRPGHVWSGRYLFNQDQI